MEDKRDVIIITFPCPECGETTSTEMTNINIIVQVKENVSMTWCFECVNCKHSWTATATTDKVNPS